MSRTCVRNCKIKYCESGINPKKLMNIGYGLDPNKARFTLRTWLCHERSEPYLKIYFCFQRRRLLFIFTTTELIFLMTLVNFGCLVLEIVESKGSYNFKVIVKPKFKLPIVSKLSPTILITFW